MTGPAMTANDLARAVVWLCRYHYRAPLDVLAGELVRDGICINTAEVRRLVSRTDEVKL